MKLKTKQFMGVSALLGLITASSVYAKNLDHQAIKNLSLSSDGISKLVVESGAGFLIVQGSSESNQIEVKADLLTQKEGYKLSLTRKGDKAVLVAEADTQNISSWFGNESPKIDLTIKVPKNMALKIDDGSGSIDINDINANVSVKDGSGSISISQINGSLDVNDGSGGMDISNISGGVKIVDGSGSITVKNTQSELLIEDGSGSINVKNVVGKVDIEDGSGSLSVSDVEGHVTIDDGSGSINVSELKNGLTIVESGSGGLKIKNVSGDIVTN